MNIQGAFFYLRVSTAEMMWKYIIITAYHLFSCIWATKDGYEIENISLWNVTEFC